MRITGYDHVQIAIPVGGEDEAVAFYEGVLGLRRVPKPEPLVSHGGCWFEGDGIRLHVGGERDFRPARKAHPALLVVSLDEAVVTLRAAGVEVHDDVAIEGYVRCYVFDPFGNRVEFMQLL